MIDQNILKTIKNVLEVMEEYDLWSRLFEQTLAPLVVVPLSQ